MKKYLVTTAIERSWPENDQVVFLGEWCRLYSRREHWRHLDADVLPYRWDDISQYDIDYKYLGDLYEHVLEVLANKLNQLHNVDHGLRYWRIMIGPWLAHFIPIIFDRWSSIQQALSSSEISKTIIIEDDPIIANDVGEFSKIMGEDSWNHYIYAYILKKYTDINCIKKENNESVTAERIQLVNSNWKINFKKKLLEIYSNIFSYFVKDRDVFIMNTYLPILDEMKLHWRFWQVPQVWRVIQPVRVPAELQQRKRLLEGHGETDLEKCVFGLISLHIPTLYLEGYNQLIEQTRRLPWPKQPKLIFSSNILWHDQVSIAYVAEKVDQGTPLVYGQHGGVYGVAKYTWSEKHEIAISDRYFSWGWDVENQPKVKPMGILKLPKASYKVEQSTSLKQKLILVTVNTSRYAYEMNREELLYFKNYFENLFEFCDCLSQPIQNDLIVRGSAVEHGWHQPLRWNDRFPDIEFDPGIYRMKDLLKETRIAVYTYNSTGYLETFTLDIPTIIFCNPNDSPLREEAIQYFDELKRVGIYHDTPESAAQHIINIWEDVDDWWESTEVREVLKIFKTRYCYQSEDLVSKVESSLKEVIAKSKYNT